MLRERTFQVVVVGPGVGVGLAARSAVAKSVRYDGARQVIAY
jgi:NAD(P)H-hydrate repair Nnr-like enzyme with NAD(P)H-hydrate dehydratase domain